MKHTDESPTPTFTRSKAHAAHDESWLMSYADMITLLMCFFIIFVSISEPKQDKLVEVTKSISGRFGQVEIATPFLGIYQNLQNIVDVNEVFADVAVTKTLRGLEIEMAAASFFDGQTAELTPQMKDTLDEMIQTLKGADFAEYDILVEGHTDDVKVHTQIYPTNWELSAARASRLVRYMIERGLNPQKLRAVGYGDTRPKVRNRDSNDQPIPQNREKNRRVVIMLERR